jgi:hypothetical protein
VNTLARILRVPSHARRVSREAEMVDLNVPNIILLILAAVFVAAAWRLICAVLIAIVMVALVLGIVDIVEMISAQR